MEQIALNTLSLCSYGEKQIDCVCGKRHTILTSDILFGNGSAAQIRSVVEKILPPASAVAIIYDCGDELCLSVRRLISTAGYRVVLCPVQGETCPQKASQKTDVAEDVRLVIGMGGELASSAAKVFSARRKLPLAIFAASPHADGYLSPFVFFERDTVPHVYRTPPPIAVVADADWVAAAGAQHAAAGFGALISKLIALFDWQFSARIDGKKYCPFIAEQAMALIDSLLDKLEHSYYNPSEQAALILDHNIRFSALSQLWDGVELYSGGEAQATACLELLFRAERRQLRLAGENKFLIAAILSKVYISALEHFYDFGFVPPPDDNLRIETAGKYLGVSEFALINRIKRYNSESLRLHDYKLREFRGEFLDLIRAYDRKLVRGMKVFKRLYEDCGYSLVGYLDRADVSLCIGLAPDLKSGFTMLAQMKQMGILDEYIA